MEILYASTKLASGDPTYGRVGPSGLSLNGRQVVDEFAFLRAAAGVVQGRDGRTTELSFRVVANFTSLREAELFVLTHHNTLPANADLQLVIGDGVDLAAVVLTSAAYVGVTFNYLGKSVVIDYIFRGGLFTTEAVPGGIPDASILKTNTIALAMNDESKAIVFGPAFGATPNSVQAIIEAPGGQLPVAVVGVGNVTAAGFTVYFAAAIPAAGYTLRWIATL